MAKMYDCSTDVWEFHTLCVIRVTIISIDNPDYNENYNDNWGDLSKEVYHYSDYNIAIKEVSKLLENWETHIYNDKPVKFYNAYSSDTKIIFRNELIKNTPYDCDVLGKRPVCIQTNEIIMERIDVDEALELNNKIKKR